MSDTSSPYAFKLHQSVQLIRAPIAGKNGTSADRYEIVRLMPADANGEISYRVKSGSSELSVREFEIKA